MKWLLVVLICACGEAPSLVHVSMVDASTPTRDAGQTLRLVLGTGAPGIFQEVIIGQQLFLQRGCQGSQHIFFSLRAWGVAESRPRITLSVEDETASRQVSSPYSLRLPYEPVSGADFFQWSGLTPVVEEPADVIGKTVTLRAQIADGPLTATDVRTVAVQWGPDSCR